MGESKSREFDQTTQISRERVSFFQKDRVKWLNLRHRSEIREGQGLQYRRLRRQQNQQGKPATTFFRFRASCGYRLHDQQWQQGYTTETFLRYAILEVPQTIDPLQHGRLANVPGLHLCASSTIVVIKATRPRRDSGARRGRSEIVVRVYF